VRVHVRVHHIVCEGLLCLLLSGNIGQITDTDMHAHPLMRRQIAIHSSKVFKKEKRQSLTI
jgi:hypothetical protein